jgi:hypothetical protein
MQNLSPLSFTAIIILFPISIFVLLQIKKYIYIHFRKKKSYITGREGGDLFLFIYFLLFSIIYCKYIDENNSI